MDWKTLAVSLLVSIITSMFSYFASTKETKVKMRSVETEYDLKIKDLETQMKKQDKEHIHKMELLEKEFEIAKENKSDDMSNKFAERFLTGELDVVSLMKNVGPLMELSDQLKNNKK